MTNKRTGQIAGIFLLAMVGIGIPGVMFRGINSSLIEDPEFLAMMIENASAMKLSIMLSFLAGIFGLGFIITIYPVLSKLRSYVALAMLGLWIFQMSVAAVGDVCHYVLIELSLHTSSHGEGSAEFLPRAVLLVHGYIGSHFLALLGYSGAFVFMNAHLLKFGLLPKWLAIWGIIATGLVFTATVLQIFDQSVSFYFYGQNALYMITVTLYLLARGFSRYGDKR